MQMTSCWVPRLPPPPHNPQLAPVAVCGHFCSLLELLEVVAVGVAPDTSQPPKRLQVRASHVACAALACWVGSTHAPPVPMYDHIFA